MSSGSGSGRRKGKGPTPRKGASNNLPPIKDGIALYHRMLKNEGFEETAETLFKLVQKAAREYPGQPRALFLDIDGHRNSKGGLDHDAWELVSNFVPGMLLPHLKQFSCPLYTTENPEPQRDDVPHELQIFPGVSGQERKDLIDSMKQAGLEPYDADLHVPRPSQEP